MDQYFLIPDRTTPVYHSAEFWAFSDHPEAGAWRAKATLVNLQEMTALYWQENGEHFTLAPTIIDHPPTQVAEYFQTPLTGRVRGGSDDWLCHVEPNQAEYCEVEPAYRTDRGRSLSESKEVYFPIPTEA